MILNMKTCKKYVCDYGTLIDTEEMERKKKEEKEAENKDTGEEEEDDLGHPKPKAGVAEGSGRNATEGRAGVDGRGR